jgi:hypothetical protein
LPSLLFWLLVIISAAALEGKLSTDRDGLPSLLKAEVGSTKPEESPIGVPVVVKMVELLGVDGGNALGGSFGFLVAGGDFFVAVVARERGGRLDGTTAAGSRLSEIPCASRVRSSTPAKKLTPSPIGSFAGLGPYESSMEKPLPSSSFLSPGAPAVNVRCPPDGLNGDFASCDTIAFATILSVSFSIIFCILDI